MYTHDTQIRVRYAETDQMGYVYYGNYGAFYEVARVECLRHLGLTYKALEDMGIMMPVLESHSKYLAPAKYDELLTIKTSIKQKPGVKIKFEYEIFSEDMQKIHVGETILVFVDKETRRPLRNPQPIIDVLGPFFE